MSKRATHKLNTPFRRHKRQSQADQYLVARLTNWQRQQWARAGYPEKDAEIQQFLGMERRQA